MVNVIPAPLAVEPDAGAPFVLAATTPVTAPASLAPLGEWLAAELAASTGVALANPDAAMPAIRLEVAPGDPDLLALPVAHGVRADNGDPGSERHIVEVAGGGVTIRGLAPEGVFRGLLTLTQLAATTEPGANGTIAIAPVTIRDAPRFAWRGLSFDVVRRFAPVAEVRQVIDLLAAYKANVLHLHLTDSEGWRIEIDAWPNLTAIGSKGAAAGRLGGFYTKDDYTGLVEYAAARFITIVPEIEMPGHTAAIFRSYPELAGDGETPPGEVMAQSQHFQAMDPDNPRIVPFLTDVFTEVAALTPGGWLHIGGDEALRMGSESYRRFMQQVKPLVGQAGKQVVAWQETARAGFAPGEIAQLWISPPQDEPVEVAPDEIHDGMELPEEESEEITKAFEEFGKLAHTDLDHALAQGARILVSQSSNAYLDTKYSELSADPGQQTLQRRLGMPFYPRSTVAAFYDWDPGAIRPQLSEEHIAGVEAAIWCESVTSLADLFVLLLPRLPGVLEKGWSAPGQGWEAYAPRIAAQAAGWERRGWPYFCSSVVWPARD